MTDHTEVEGTWGFVADEADDAIVDTCDPGAETETGAEAPTDTAWPAADEWDDLRQVFAGDEPPAAVEADDDGDEDDDEDAEVFVAEVDDAVAELSPLHEAVAALAQQVEDLSADLEDERAARERLSDQLGRLASELDAVLGEALAEEREKRQEIEEALRQVQATLIETPDYSGPDRRVRDEDRRSDAERRRGLPPRPLRARTRRSDPAPEPVDVVTDDDVDDVPIADEDHGEDVHDDEVFAEPETRTAWKSRLHEVAGSVSAWSADDIDRLRVD